MLRPAPPLLPMRRLLTCAAWLSALLSGCSCSQDSGELLVDVSTDLVAGREFFAIETELFDTEPGTGVAARERAEAARQIQFDETREGSFIVVLAPLSGVVTNIAYSQAGDKVQANTPLLSIAPQGSRKVLEIDILESDRGLLDEGSLVKMKFGAFPYQQYGFIEGTLEYISPTTRQTDPSRPPTYRGKVSLVRDFVEVDGKPRPLRYGMSAMAEIVVRQRRVIDMALDPMRGN